MTHHHACRMLHEEKYQKIQKLWSKYKQYVIITYHSHYHSILHPFNTTRHNALATLFLLPSSVGYFFFFSANLLIGIFFATKWYFTCVKNTTIFIYWCK